MCVYICVCFCICACMCFYRYICVSWLIYPATHCNTLQHTAAHCNTLQHAIDPFACHDWYKYKIWTTQKYIQVVATGKHFFSLFFSELLIANAPNLPQMSVILRSLFDNFGNFKTKWWALWKLIIKNSTYYRKCMIYLFSENMKCMTLENCETK